MTYQFKFRIFRVRSCSRLKVQATFDDFSSRVSVITVNLNSLPLGPSPHNDAQGESFLDKRSLNCHPLHPQSRALQ